MAAPIGGAPPWMERPWPPRPSTSTNKIDGFDGFDVEFDYDDNEDVDMGNEYVMDDEFDDALNPSMGNEYVFD